MKKIIIKGVNTMEELNTNSFRHMDNISRWWRLGRLCDRFEEFPERHEGGL